MSRIERICLRSMVRSGREADTRCVVTIAFLLLWIGSEIMLGDTLMIWPVLFVVNFIGCLYACRDRVLVRLLNVEEKRSEGTN